MDFFVWQRTIVDEAGNVLPLANVAVTDVVSGGGAQLYSDEGTTAIGNPTTADANGFARFYVRAGRYDIVATSGLLSREWESETIGRAYRPTQAEVSASAVITDYQYPPGHLFRYGANVTPGTTDMTAAWQAMVSFPGRKHVPAERYYIADTILIDIDDVEIDAEFGAEIFVDANWPDGQEIFLIEGPGLGTSTNLTANATQDLQALTVTSTAAFSLGQLFVIASSGEYWSGITGLAGFSVVNKSEMNRVQIINSSTSLTTEWVLEDNYDDATYNVTVTPLSTIKNIAIRGLVIRGNGAGSAHVGAVWGPFGIAAYYVENIEVEGCTIIDCGTSAAEFTLCHDVRVTNNKIHGRDNENSTNQPNISPWFYGVVFTGSVNCTFSHNTCQNLRRPIDANYTSGTTIPRNISCVGNTVISCQNGLGTHISQHVTMVGNTLISCPGGIYFRGKDAVISGNILRAYDTGTSVAMITLGNGSGTAYTENPSTGHVVISGNKCYGRVTGVYARTAFESLLVEGNSFVGGNSYGVHVTAKYVKNLKVRGNLIDSYRRTANRFGVWLENATATNPMVYCENVDVSGNTIMNENEGVRLEGTSATSTTGSITTGTATLTVSAYAASIMRPGLYVRVIGAGAAGADHVTTISSISISHSVGTITLTANAGTTVTNANVYWLAPATGILLDGNKTGRGIAGTPNWHVRVGIAGHFDGERTFIRNHVALSVALNSPDVDFGTTRNFFSQLPTLSVDDEIAKQSSTTLQSKSTVVIGQKIRNTAPAAGTQNQWTITTAGTVGTITGGTTGSITAGSNQLTLNANSDARAFPGAYLRITGAGVAAGNLDARVIEVNGANVTIVTLDTAASTTVAGNAVAYIAPVFKASDAIAA